jgi:hypothetical protein
MSIHYNTIGDTLAFIIFGILIFWFLAEGIKAFRAIVRDHNGYVDDLEMELTDLSHENTNLQADLNAARDWQQRVNDFTQMTRLSEKLAKETYANAWPTNGEMEETPDGFLVYQSDYDWQPVGPWGIPEDVPMEKNGPLTTTNDSIGPSIPPLVEIPELQNVHYPNLEEMEAAGYPAGE